MCELLWVLLQFDTQKAHQQVRGKNRKRWLPILLGLFIPAGMAVAQVPVDSIPAVQDSVVSVQDTVTAVRDTIPQGPRKKKDSLEDPVIYESTDSMVWNNGGYASLYGDGKVNYQNVQLTAAVIKMQMDSSLVYADGRLDSAGVMQGAPVFVDGSTPYESNHISYNFKTEKGYINEIITQQGEGYMTSQEAKKGPEGEYYIADGVYTTCDQHDDPHFNIRITRAKVRPGRDVIFGPAYLEVMGVPLPLFVPFGFFLPVLFRNIDKGIRPVICGFLFSLMVETIQLVSRVGIFDVDDLILNTAGVLAGFLVFRFCNFLRLHAGRYEAGKE